MDRYNWSEVPEEKMSPTLSRRVIHSEQMTIARMGLAKGAVVPMHHHINQQVTMLTTGELEFEMGEPGQATHARFVLKAGDVLVIPPNLPHRVVALEDSTATDLFTPPREDWIRGDDAYLRK